MSEYKLTDRVRFYIGGGYLSGNREQTFTLEDLYFDEQKLEDMSNAEVDEAIQLAYDDWMVNNAYFGWHFTLK